MIIDTELLDKVTEQAKASPRLRMNYNFHESLDDKCHKLSDARPRTRLGKAYASIALLSLLPRLPECCRAGDRGADTPTSHEG
jgi:hypothetical protein